MPGSLACILSAGLTCAPAKVEVVEAPTPTPLTPAGDPPEEEAPVKGAASAMLAKVQAFYDGTKDLQADFKQTYIHPVYGTKKVSEGKLKALKPGKMIWDYEKSANPDFWVDGSKVWVVERDTKQVIQKDLGKSDVAGAEKFLFGGKQLTEDFLIKVAEPDFQKRYGMKDHTAVRLRPKKKNPHYKELMLVIDDATGRVDAFVVLNQDKSTNHFVLEGLSRNSGLGAGDFKFKKPAGFAEIKE
jgi:outer membrane lipoprotein carrier protein